MTILSAESTVKLFNCLLALKCILHDEHTSKESITKAIQALTGYSSKQTKEYLLFQSTKNLSKTEKEKFVEIIKDLIMNNL